LYYSKENEITFRFSTEKKKPMQKITSSNNHNAIYAANIGQSF